MSRLRRLLFVTAAACMALGCGHSDAEFAQVSSERDALRSQHDSLAHIIDELQHGAPRMIALTREAFSKSAFAEVIARADTLARLHPGSTEAVQAQQLAIRAQASLTASRDSAMREASRSKAEKLRSIIRVASVTTSDPNSAGGVDLRIRWQNTSKKTVKYAHFSVVAYNAVGDPVECTIRGYSEFNGQATGPIRPGEWAGEDRLWENAWYNSTIVRGKLTEIQLEYTDGSTEDIAGDDVKLVRT